MKHDTTIALCGAFTSWNVRFLQALASLVSTDTITTYLYGTTGFASITLAHQDTTSIIKTINGNFLWEQEAFTHLLSDVDMVLYGISSMTPKNEQERVIYGKHDQQHYFLQCHYFAQHIKKDWHHIPWIWTTILDAPRYPTTTELAYSHPLDGFIPSQIHPIPCSIADASSIQSIWNALNRRNQK